MTFNSKLPQYITLLPCNRHQTSAIQPNTALAPTGTLTQTKTRTNAKAKRLALSKFAAAGRVRDIENCANGNTDYHHPVESVQ